MNKLDKLIMILFVSAVVIVLVATFSRKFALIGVGFIMAGISVGLNVYRIKETMAWKDWIAPLACVLVGISFLIMALVI